MRSVYYISSSCKPLVNPTHSIMNDTQRPILDQKCNSSTFGCLSGLICDKVTSYCRIPRVNESCLFSGESMSSCESGYNCINRVCSLPEEGNECNRLVGCKYGNTCDDYTGSCRKPLEGELCSLSHGCTEGLVCTNFEMIARLESSSGNILVRYFDLPLNTSAIPNFNTIAPAFISYAEEIDFSSTIEYPAAVFEGYLTFPSSGAWSLNLNSSNLMYNLWESNTSLIQNDGNLLRTINSVFITEPNETRKIRLECLKKANDSFLILNWSNPSGHQLLLSSTQWEMDKRYVCRKPIFSKREFQRSIFDGRCNRIIGCEYGLSCQNNTCVVRLINCYVFFKRKYCAILTISRLLFHLRTAGALCQ